MTPLRKAAVVYTASRFGLFVIFSLLVWSVGGLAGVEINGFLLLIIALVLSSVAGWFLLAAPRERLARAVAAQRGAAPEVEST